jgi:anaerobic selenocysteine-containing dehydrogenase
MNEPVAHYRTCPLCEATCGLEVTARDRQVVRIRGDEQDVFSRGFLCPKGATLKHLHEDPDRLRAPYVRRGSDPARAEWQQVTWDEAFAEVERRLTPILERHGRDAVALYFGNPTVHSVDGTIYGRPLAKALATRNLFSASTVDQMPKHVSSGLLFGNANAIPVPDLDRTDFLLMLGANPYESNGSLCTAPDFPGRMRAIQQRGGRCVVVDPRRTRTAQHADEHVAIRPGTDAHFLLALIHVVLEEGRAELGRLAPHVSGFDALRDHVAPFSAEAVAPITRVPAETTRRLARELASTPRAVVYGRIGTHTVEFGTIAAWAVDVLNCVTGHLDSPGGAMWALPAHATRGSGKPGKGFRTGRYRSRVKAYPEVRSEFPVATLADEIEVPGDGQVRALITVAGNPVLSTPDGRRLERALAGLECLISVDPYRNETTRYAHVILPPPSQLCRSQYELAFYGLAVRNIAKWSPALFAPEGPSEADILAKLALIAAGQGAGADTSIVHALVQQTLLDRAVLDNPLLAGADVGSLSAQLVAEKPTDRAVEILIRSGAYGDAFGRVPKGLTFDALRDRPHGIDLGPLEPRIPEVLETPSGTVELMPSSIATDLARLRATLDGARADALLLVGRRHLLSNNSWMHNVPVLVRGRERCTLQMNPEDATRLGLRDGQTARVASRVGEIVAPVEVTDSLMPGVVSLPHGWGHDAPGTQLSVAAKRPGVNSNLLTDPECVDPLSGNAVLNGIPVTVTALSAVS